MAEAGGGRIDLELTAPNLAKVLGDLKEIDPRLATATRRQLRAAGDEIIAAQRARLANRPPRVGGSTKKLVIVRPKNRAPYPAFRRTYQPGDTREGGVSELRSKIAAGLHTRILTGKSRQGVEIKTGGPRNGGANMARVYQSKQFRHPVFGSAGQWATQFGQPYFFKPVTDEMRTRMTARLEEAIRDALSHL